MQSILQEKHLVMFLDIRNSILFYHPNTQSMYMQKMKKKIFDIFEKEKTTVNYFSIVVPSDEDQNSIDFVFKHIKMNQINLDGIKNLFEYLKYKNSQKNDITGYDNFQNFLNLLVQTLSSQEELTNTFLDIRLMLNVDTFFLIEEIPSWNLDSKHKSKYSIEVVLMDDQFFHPSCDFKKIRYKSEVRLECLRNEFSVNSELFEEDFVVNDVNFFFEKSINQSDEYKYRKTYSAKIDIFVNLKHLQNWNLINQTETEFLFKNGKNGSIICKIKEVDFESTISYRNVEMENENEVLSKIKEDSNIFLFSQKTDFFNNELNLELFDKNTHLLKVFRMKYFYFIIDDFVIPEKRTDIFIQIAHLLREKPNTAVIHYLFIIPHEKFNIVCEMQKLSRNFFLMRVYLMSANYSADSLDFASIYAQLKKDFKEKIKNTYLINKSIMRIIVINHHQKNIDQQARVFYRFEKFNYYLFPSENEQFKIQKHELLNYEFILSDFFEKYLEIVLTNKLQKRAYIPLINNEPKKMNLFFFKILNSSENGEFSNKKALSLIKLTINKKTRNKIGWKVLVPNTFLPLHQSYLDILKNDYTKIKMFIDKFTTPLIIYCKILKNIKHELRKESDTRIKANLFSIKYDFVLIYFSEAQKRNLKVQEISKAELLNKLLNFVTIQLTKLKFTSKDENSFTKEGIEWLLKFSTKEQIDISHFNQCDLNKSLFQKYCKLMNTYCEFSLLIPNGSTMYFKLLRPDIYVGYVLTLDGKGEKIILSYYMMCLLCLRDVLKDKSHLILNSNLTKECKYESQNFNSATSKCRTSVKRMLDLVFILQSDEESTNHHLILNANKSNTFIAEIAYKFDLTEIVQRINEIAREKPDFYTVINNEYNVILDTVLNLLFNIVSKKIDKDVFTYYNFKNPETSKLRTFLTEKIGGNSTISEQLEIILSDFAIFANLNYEQIKMIRFQIIINSPKKNFSFSKASEFFDILLKLGDQKNVVLMVRELVPNFAKIAHFFEKNDEEYLRSYKVNADVSDNYFNTVISTVYNFVREFVVKFREKIKNTIHKAYSVYFSSLFFELFFYKHEISGKFPIAICKTLEDCCKVHSLQTNFFQDDISSIKNGLGKHLLEYLIEKRVDKKNHQKNQTCFFIVPSKQPMNFFFNYIIYSTKLEIKFYSSFKMKNNDAWVCNDCENFLKIIETNPINAHQFLLEKIFLNFYQKYNEKVEKTKNCHEICRSLTLIFSYFYNQKIDSVFQKMNETQKIDVEYLYTSSSQTDFSKNEFKIYSTYKKPIMFQDFSFLSVELYKNLIFSLENHFLRMGETFLVETESLFYLMTISFTNSEIGNKDFILNIEFYSPIKEGYFQEFQKISKMVESMIHSEITKKIKTILSKTNMIQRNAILMTFVNSILQHSVIQIAIPVVNEGALIFYLNKLMERSFKKVVGNEVEMRNATVQKNFGTFAINGTCTEMDKYTFDFNQSEYSYFRINTDSVQNDVSGGIFYFEYDIRTLTLFIVPQTATIDNSILFGVIEKEEIESQNWSLNKFIDTKTNKIDFDFFTKKLNSFKFVENEIRANKRLKMVRSLSTVEPKLVNSLNTLSSENVPLDILKKMESEKKIDGDRKSEKRLFINLQMSHQSENNNTDNIQKELIKMLQFAFYEYFIEMVFSSYLLASKEIPVNKSYITFASVVNNLFRTPNLMPVSFKYRSFENHSYLIYLFHYFMELCGLILATFTKSCPHFKAIFQCTNSTNDPPRKITKCKKFKKNTTRFPEDFQTVNFISTNIIEFKKDVLRYFENRNNLFNENELKFSLILLPEEMSFDDILNDVSVVSTGVDFDEKYEKILMFPSNSTEFETKDGRKKIRYPPRRFFYVLNYIYKEIENFSYNLNENIFNKINKNIEKLDNSLILKREFFKFSSMQKLGFHFREEDVKISEKSKTGTSFYRYSEMLSKINAEPNGVRLHNYTQLVMFLLESPSDNKLFSKIMNNKIFHKHIIRDFLNVQFYFINNINSVGIELEMKMKSLPEVF